MFKEKRCTVFEHHRKKSHSTLQAKACGQTVLPDKEVSLNRAKISGKCHNRKTTNETFWVIFKQCTYAVNN